jgi:hypothetical protein
MTMNTKPSKRRSVTVIVFLLLALIINVFALFRSRANFETTAAFLGEIFIVLVVLSFAFVGSLILARQPRHLIGWLLIIPPLMMTVQQTLNIFFGDAVAAASELTIGLFLIVWFNAWSWWLLIGPILLIFQLYPNGKVASPRWRWAIFLLVASFLLFFFVATFAGIAETDTQTWANPIGFLSPSAVEAMISVMAIGLGLSVILSLISVFVRYRNAQAVERAQLRWLLFACALFLVCYLPGFLYSGESQLFNILFGFSLLGLPLAIGIAILRYRLWDIDVVINRSIVYALLTTLLAAVFAATAAIASQIAKAAFGEEMQQAAAAVAAVVAASLFQPLRAWVEDVINRRLFPENIDLSKGLIELNSNLWSWIGLPKILLSTLDHLEGIYDCDQIAIYLKDGEKYYPAASLGIPKADLKPYTPSAAQQSQLSAKRGLITEEEKPFTLTAPIYLARRKAPELIGVLRLGKRKKGRGYSGSDVKTLVGFGAKLAEPIYALSTPRKG